MKKRRAQIPYKQIRDVLEIIRQFHAELKSYFEKKKGEVAEPKAAWLLEFVSRHEGFLETCLEKFNGNRDVLDTWIQFVPEESLRKQLEEGELTPETGLQEAFARVVRWDEALLELYRHLASATSAPRVQELFHHLLELEKAKKEEFSKGLLQFQHEVYEPEAGENPAVASQAGS